MTKIKVKEIKKAIQEAIDVNPISTSDKKLVSFLEEVDKCLETCRDSVTKVIDKGLEIVEEDLDAKDRNELIIGAVNVLKRIKLVLVQSVEVMKKHVG